MPIDSVSGGNAGNTPRTAPKLDKLLSASAALMAAGCQQYRICHTGKCPVGITTQDPGLNKGLVLGVKAQRVYRYHKSSVQVLKEIVAAAGHALLAAVATAMPMIANSTK